VPGLILNYQRIIAPLYALLTPSFYPPIHVVVFYPAGVKYPPKGYTDRGSLLVPIDQLSMEDIFI
jgi:hypothetical protein